MHVAPGAEGLAFQRLGAEAEDVAIGIFRRSTALTAGLHLERPLKIGRGIADLRTAGFKFFMEFRRVADADPDPGRDVALVAFAEHEVAVSA